MNESIRTRIFRFSLTNRQTACATAFVLLTIYLGTLAPTLFVHDSAELAAGAMTLGIVHAPGYPVYLLTAHAFTHLPFGDVAYRVNLLSAVSTACAVGLLVWFLLQLRLSKPVASATGFVFGLSFYTWSLSVIAEVYTFQILVLALLFCGAWHWREQGDVRAFYLTAWVLGISAANNLATGLWWGGILVLLVWRASDKRQTQITRSVLGGAVLAFLFGLAFVLYLPLRSLADPALNYAGHFDETGTFYPLDLSQINNLVWYMTGGPFKTLVGSYTPLELIAEARATIIRLNAAFLGIGLPLGLWGTIVLARRSPLVTVACWLTIVPHLTFFTIYHVVDKDTMFLPVYFVFSILFGVGLAQLMRQLPTGVHHAVWLVPIAFFVINRGYIDVQAYESVRSVAYERLESAENNSIYFGKWSDAAAMEYLQSAEDVRPDVLVINTFLIHPTTQYLLITDALANQQAVYSSYEDPKLARSFRFAPRIHSFQLELP